MALYIYGVIETNSSLEFGAIGLGEERVYTVGTSGVAFVVSEARFTEYIADSLNLGEHERVLESVMKERVILPLRFGSVAESERELLLMLKRHGSSFSRMLKKLYGKVEVKVEILWRDMKNIFDEIVSASAKLSRLKTSPQSRNEVIMAGQLVYQLLLAKKKSILPRLVGKLKRFAVDYVLNPVSADELIMNGSFLIEGKRLGEFDKALDLLDKENGDKMRIRYIGPLPPYSFASMRLS